MTESTTSGGKLKFKAPASDEWRALQVDSQVQLDSQDKDLQEKTNVARDALKETLLASLQMQHVVVLAGSGTSLGPVGGPSMKDLWDAAIGNIPTKEATNTAKKINYDFKVLTPNIEEFLSKAEASLQVKEGDTDVKDFVDSCKKVILAWIFHGPRPDLPSEAGFALFFDILSYEKMPKPVRCVA